jgi:hypothetical protein
MSMAPTAEQWARQQGWEAAIATAACRSLAQLDLLTAQRNRLRDEVERFTSEFSGAAAPQTPDAAALNSALAVVRHAIGRIEAVADDVVTCITAIIELRSDAVPADPGRSPTAR